MIDLLKSLEFFNPDDLHQTPVHIIGLGAIGSTVAELLARLGVDTMHLYDFDTVEPPNVANQMYDSTHIGKPKTEALAEILTRINPAIKLQLHNEGWTDQQLNGYVFMAVDNIKIRQQIVKENKYNLNIKAVLDFRMRLEDAQHYAADWSDVDQQKRLLDTMSFTEEEAKEATPVSACGTTLSVAPTIRNIVSLGIANWINFVKTNKIKTMILINAFKFLLDAF